jgi:beta-glucosidase
MTLPDDFTWGVATSAYQIEGAWDEDGKGESIWDRFAHEGRIGDTGDVACDHFHRLEEDLDLLADLGVDAYRFSIAWTRVLPEGRGPVNPPGLAFYDRLVDGLLERGIEPVPTLYHWDLPQALQDEGGWERRGIADDFAAYAEVVARHFAGRVRRWLTLNEPWVASYMGHLYGVFAPGLTSWQAALAAGHHQLLAHGRAVAAMRRVHPAARIGLALDCRHAVPASGDPADVDATRHFDGFRNRWFFDPVFGQGYPADMLEVFADRLPGGLVVDGDLDEIAIPIDHLGLNYYTSIRIDPEHREQEFAEAEPGPSPAPGHTEMGWRIDPDALAAFLRRVHEEWGPAEIMITENGASYGDGPDGAGRIRDQRRIDYIAAHVAAVEEARADGVPVTGYFVWSFMDNLEWAQGFAQRFGLVWVDPATGERIPKDSFAWYRELIS